MKKHFKVTIILLLMIVLSIINQSKYVNGSQSSYNEETVIELVVIKAYTVATNIKCYELVPAGKYKDMNKVVIVGDPGVPNLVVNKRLKLIIED